MKRTISILLALCLLLPAGIINSFAADDSGLSKAITAAKAKFPVPAEYKTFTYSVNDQNGQKVWNLAWDNGKNSTVRISVDENGRLRQYSQNTPNDYDGKMKAPLITSAQAKAIADAAIAKAVPEVSGRLQKSGNGANTYSSRYYFTYERVENGIPLPANTVEVEVDYTTKTVKAMSVSWEYNVTIPSPKGIITKETAEKALKGALEVRLSYKLRYDVKSGETDQAYLVYTDTTGYRSINPFTGEVYTQAYSWAKSPASDTAEYAPGLANKSTAAYSGFTEEELNKISEAQDLMTPEEADKLLRANPYLSIDSSYTLTGKTLRTDYSDESRYLWNLEYTGTVVKEDFNAPYASATVDAKTGEIFSFYSYDKAEQAGSPAVDEAASEKTAAAFLTGNAKNKFESTKKDDSADPVYVNPEDTKEPTAYGFHYTRIHENIPLDADSLYVSVSAFTGKVESYSCNWHDNINFEATSGILTAPQAIDKMVAQCGFALQYEPFTTYYYGKEKAATEEGSTASASASASSTATSPDLAVSKILPPIPMPTIPNSTSVRLVYVPDYSRPMEVLAHSGELADYNGGAYKKATGITYSDLQGSDIKTQATLLADIGIGFDGGKLNGSQGILQKEFLYLLMKTWSVYLPFSNASELSNKDNIDELYAQCIQKGILKESEKKPDAVITKIDALRYLIRAAGYEKAALIKGIYKTPFKDDAAIAAADKGYCALAYGLGIVGGSGSLEPAKNLSRAQSIGMLYNYLKM